MADAAKNAWLAKVLHINVPVAAAPTGAAPSAAAPDMSRAAALWRAASDTVDGQIAALQVALRGENDSELADIAEYGLNAITGGFKVKLMAALMGAERGDAKSRQALAGLIPAFRQHLQSDERIEACDENPFDVPMSVRATLLPALDELAKSAAA